MRDFAAFAVTWLAAALTGGTTAYLVEANHGGDTLWGVALTLGVWGVTFAGMCRTIDRRYYG